MQRKKNLTKILLVFVVGALLTYLGIPVPEKDIVQVADAVTNYAVSTQGDVVATSTTSQSFDAEVTSVIDGDTLAVRTDGATPTHVRVLGINTPETKYSNTGAECYGQDATEYAKTLVHMGDMVTLTPDPTQDVRDKYSRILAYVTLPDGRDFGEVMIQNGYAYEYTFKGRTYQKQALYKELQTKAQKEGIGLWSVCNEEKL